MYKNKYSEEIEELFESLRKDPENNTEEVIYEI